MLERLTKDEAKKFKKHLEFYFPWLLSAGQADPYGTNDRVCDLYNGVKRVLYKTPDDLSDNTAKEVLNKIWLYMFEDLDENNKKFINKNSLPNNNIEDSLWVDMISILEDYGLVPSE